MKERIRDVIYNYDSKYPIGFIQSEILNILNEFKILEADFNKQMGVNTVMVINEDIIYYHIDVYNTILCIKENRDLTTEEWD